MKNFPISKLYLYQAILLAICFSVFNLRAQTSIDWSVYNGNANNVNTSHMDTMGGYIYVLGTTYSTSFATTNSSTLNGQDLFISKYDLQGNRIFSKLIGATGNDDLKDVIFANNKIYTLGTAKGNDFPTAISSTYKDDDILVSEINTNGDVVKAIYLGSSVIRDQAISIDLIDDNLFIGGMVQGTGYPVTNGSSFKGLSDIVFTKIDTAFNIKYSTYLGGNSREHYTYSRVFKDKIAFVGTTHSSNFFTTNSSVHQGSSDLFCTIFDTAGSIFSSSLHGHASYNYFSDFIFEDSQIFVHGYNTDESYFSNPFTDINGYPKNVGILTIDIYGNEIYSTALGNDELGKVGQAVYYNKELYYIGATSDLTYRRTNNVANNGDLDFFFTKLDKNGELIHSFYFGGNGAEYSSNYRKFFFIKNNKIHLHGFTTSTNITSTDGSTQKGSFDNLIYRLDTAGNEELVKYMGSSLYDKDKTLERNSEYLFFSEVNGNDYPVTQNSNFSGTADIGITKLGSNGKVLISSYLGGEKFEYFMDYINFGKKILIYGGTESTKFPVTLNESSNLSSLSNTKSHNYFLTMLNICPTKYDIQNDVLAPSIQVVCRNGFVTQIIGKKMIIPGDSLPIVYKNTVASFQQEIEASYQWQVSNSIIGPWSDIFGAVLKDYTPSPTVVNRYYRRISKMHPCCGDSIINISDIAIIAVNSLTAPTVDAGGLFNTCPSSSLSIGGSPSASGGTTPYSYSWDIIAAPDSGYANPSVAPTTNTVYTLTVTDNNGCVQKDQCLVNVYKANAGPDVWACSSDSAKILTQIPQGVSGVTYSWTPTTGLSNPNVAQPLANPGTTTTYILTQTIPKTGGGTCSSMDTVVVNKINGPSVANFLGADDTICNYNTKTFNPNTTGLPPGTTYEWSPKSYLDFPMSANAVYNPTIKGQLIQPDPITYTLTASVGGCHFTDNITLSVIYANPSFGGCNLSGEQIITNTNVPDLNETFSWSKLSGAATIIGSTTNSSLLVDVATGASTFQIETTLGSTTCIGTASTPGCGCGVNFSVQCPLVFGDSIRIVATPKVGSVTDYNYTWTPGSGLSNYDSFVTFANDNIDRTYTVNIVSKIDTSFKCSNSIYIDPSSFTLPVIVALDDTVCPGEVINLGETHHAGHTYSWNPSGAVSDYEISNPTHTAVNTIDIIVTKTRTSNLCVGRDTASIVVQDVYANAGEDKVICSSSTLQLGTPALPNCKYSWKPTIAAFQNGTTDSTAQPDVLVAITQTFTLIVTDTITGCNAYDTVTIEVNGIPTLTDYPDTFICYGGNITIGAPAISGVTYSWSPTTGLNNPNIAQPTCSVNSNTAYTLTASFPGGCNAQDNVFVTVHDPSFSLSDISYCPSNGALAIGTAAPTVMTSYNWSPASLLSSSTIRNPSTFNPPPSGNTTFTLQVLDAFGCTADTFLTIIPSLSEPLAGPNKILCKNSSSTIGSTSNNTGAGISYTWSPAYGLSSTTSVNPTFTPTDTGVYQIVLTKTNSGTSCTSRDTVIMTALHYEIDVTSPAAICKNSSQVIVVTNDINATYYWSPTSYLSDSTTSMVTATPPQTTTYTLMAIGANGCFAREDIVVGVRNTTAPSIFALDVDTCLQDSMVTLFAAISPAAPYSYHWTPNNGTIVNSNVEDAQVRIIATGSYQYNLEVTDTAGCKVNKDVGLAIRVCSLPVELLYFNATKKGNSSILEWATVTEINNDYFGIERSTDGENWENIGRVNSFGDGNSVGISTYSFTDTDPYTGLNLYRLKQVDFDGTIDYSKIRALQFKLEASSEILIYPIPSFNNVHIETADLKTIEQIEVRDIQGKTIRVKCKVYNSNSLELQTKELAKGIYYVTVYLKDGLMENRKIVLE